jgi:hypothetical protein
VLMGLCGVEYIVPALSAKVNRKDCSEIALDFLSFSIVFSTVESSSRRAPYRTVGGSVKDESQHTVHCLVLYLRECDIVFY